MSCADTVWIAPKGTPDRIKRIAEAPALSHVASRGKDSPIWEYAATLQKKLKWPFLEDMRNKVNFSVAKARKTISRPYFKHAPNRIPIHNH